MKVAVIAHSGKTVGGGLSELRRVLETEGIDDPLWCEVPKSRKAPPQVRRALDEGCELVFAWGGDGMVQRCIDVLAGSKASLAIIPAGTANLFATNLGVPKDIEEAVAIGLRGERRKLDVGRFNGERFGVMAGAGFDAAMIRERGRRPQGPVRPRGVRLDRLARTCAPNRSARRSRSTASAGTRARRAASCSATSASSSAASRRSRTRGRTTASSNSAS